MCDSGAIKAPLSDKELFYQGAAIYTTMGMPYELYWYGDADLVEIYRELNEYQIEKRNQELWLQGLYNYKAVAAALEPFANVLSKHKVPQDGYIKNPIPITKAEEERDKQRRIEATLKWVQEGQRDK